VDSDEGGIRLMGVVLLQEEGGTLDCGTVHALRKGCVSTQGEVRHHQSRKKGLTKFHHTFILSQDCENLNICCLSYPVYKLFELRQ
jgi:hypothetical protein